MVCVTATSASAHDDRNWDALGGTVDLSPYMKTADASKTYATKQEVQALDDDVDSRLSELSGTLDTKLAKGDVVNNLTTSDGTKALSAAQGKKLQDEKLSKTDASSTYATKSELTSHTGNKSNPHGVTKAQVGLSNVTNDAQVKRSEVVDNYNMAKIGSANEVPSTNAFKKAAGYAEMFPVSFDAIETGTKTIIQSTATTSGGLVVWLDDMKKFAYKSNGSYYNNWSIQDSPNPALTNADLVKVLGTNGPIPGKCYITNGTLFFSTGSDLAYVANFTELSNSLSDSSTSKALTAAQGKKLQDEKLSKTEASGTYLTKASAEGTYAKKTDLGIVIE